MLSNVRKMTWSSVMTRTLVFSLVWWVLTEGNVHSWGIGVPAVAFAVVASIALLPPAPLVWRELLGFAPFFFWRSLRGGADVAWRAFHPRVPIAPGVIDHQLGLPPGIPRVCMVNIVSLLPGTLSVELEGPVLRVHVLDTRGDYLTELKSVEHRLARVCGVLPATFDGGE
jgi:multicomponent Na+:H+ antiporter subunit E